MKNWRADQFSLLEWRKKELGDIKASADILGSSYLGLSTRSALLLCYAHWEGAFADNTRLMLDFLRDRRVKVSDIGQGFLLGFIDRELDRLRDKNHSPEARVAFAEYMSNIADADISSFRESVILPRSNLNSERLGIWCRILGRSPIFLEKRRIFLDYQLVRLRYQIAHGGSPKLNIKEISHIVDETIELIDDFSSFVLDFIEETL